MLRQSTEYLLQKVSAQIRGDKIIPSKFQSTSLNKETNDLDDYLQSLGSNKKKLTNWNEDLSDISDVDSDVKPAASTFNRFLKKPAPAKIETTKNEDFPDNNNSLVNNKFLKKSTEPTEAVIDKTIQNANLITNGKLIDSKYLTDKELKASSNLQEDLINTKIKNAIKNDVKIDFNKIVLDDSDESIVNYLNIQDLDEPDEIETDRPKKGILKSPSSSNRLEQVSKPSPTSNKETINNKSEIFGLVHNIDELVPAKEITSFRNNEYESDFETTARSVRTPRRLSSRLEDHGSKIYKQNSSVESTPRYSHKSPGRKVSISTKKEIFKSTSSKGDIASRPITPATSRSYMSTEIEEASQLEMSSSSQELSKSDSNNSTILSTKLEVLPDSKKSNRKSLKQSLSKEKKYSRQNSSKSSNYSDDFENTFEKESISSSAGSVSSTSHLSTISIRKKSKKKKVPTATLR